MSLTDRSSFLPAPTIEAVLRGGPDNLPDDLRTDRVSTDQQKLKVPHYGGYEHFERLSTDRDADGRLVFYWTGRTRVAE